MHFYPQIPAEASSKHMRQLAIPWAPYFLPFPPLIAGRGCQAHLSPVKHFQDDGVESYLFYR